MLDTVSYSDFRAHLKNYLDKVCDDSQPLRIMRRNGKRVVILSEEDFQSLDETAYLLASPANAKRLKSALKGKKAHRYSSVKALGDAFGLKA